MNEASCPQFQNEAAPFQLKERGGAASAEGAQSPTCRETVAEAIVFDKRMRVEIDGLVQAIRNAPKSAERTLAMRDLQSAKHWLGEDLAILGAANPYPNGKNPANTIVDPTADVAPTPKTL